jgi:hypothetical protein
MLRRLTLLFGAALCLALVACGPSLIHLENRSVTKAQLLQTEAAAANLEGDDIVAGDKYLAMATGSGVKKADAMSYADLAAAHYRSALARYSLEASRKSLVSAEASLAAGEEAVQKYQKILTEISAGKEK